MDAVQCLIVVSDGDDSIVDHDMLGELGIDADRQFEQLAAHGDDEMSGDPFDFVHSADH